MEDIRYEEGCPKCGWSLSRYKHLFAKIWCSDCGFVIREEGEKQITDFSKKENKNMTTTNKCPVCGGNTNTYRHPFAKVWCIDCGFVIREEGEKQITDFSKKENKNMAFIPPKDLAVKKYMLKVAIQILKNEDEGESYASEILKQELERIEEHERED